jgi:hypothetical protein
MGEYPVEQEAVTVCHDVLEDVQMTALGRYPVGGKVFYFFRAPRQSERIWTDPLRDVCTSLIALRIKWIAMMPNNFPR